MQRNQKWIEKQPLISHISSIPLLIHLLEKIFDHEGIKNVQLGADELFSFEWTPAGDEICRWVSRRSRSIELGSVDIAEMIRPLQFWVNLEECFLPEEIRQWKYLPVRIDQEKRKLQETRKVLEA